MKTTNESVQAMLSTLENAVNEITSGEQFAEYLRIMAKFHKYSARNVWLIKCQCPEASRVAGFSTWKKSFGRYVKKGESAIKILAPAPFKVTKTDKDGNEKEIVIPAYKPAYVFDIAQTDGKPLPENPAKAAPLSESSADLAPFLNILEKISPCPVSFEDISSTGANGFYRVLDKRIVVDSNLSNAQTIKTTIHEIAHATLHAAEKPEDRKNLPSVFTMEVQAEAVAYVVCNHFDIDTAGYSFGYVSEWKGTMTAKEFHAALEGVRKAACAIIESIETTAA